MKIIGGVVTYNPEIALLCKCIRSLTNICEKVIVIDNGSHNFDQIKNLLSNRVVVIENAINMGIAKALNQLFIAAKECGADWVLTLDQDTIVPMGTIEKFQMALAIDPQIAIVCPRIHDIASGIIWPEIDEKKKIDFVERCITSGSLNSIKVWEKIGQFDERLFIDEVDHDYCLRIIKSGYKICLVTDVIIHHKIGDTKIKQLFGKKIYIRNHSAFRKYYICRNIIYMSKKHKGKVTVESVVHVFAFMLKTVMWEEDKINKFHECIRGLCDGVKLIL